MRNKDGSGLAQRRVRNVARERLLNLSIVAEQKRREESCVIRPRAQWATPIPLSHAQERLWFLDQAGPIGNDYTLALALRLKGVLDVPALEHAFTELVQRHECLRTRFGVKDGVPCQVIGVPGPFELQRADLSAGFRTEMERDRQLRERIEREQLHRFDLSKGPLFRVLLVKLGSCEHLLLLTMHHIVSDGWSLGILTRELGELYGAFDQSNPSPLPKLPIQYADYAIWQRQWLQGEVLKGQLQYWKEQLAGVSPQLELPTDRPRPAVESFRGATLKFDLSAQVANGVRDLALRAGATVFMVFLAAYQLLLSRWSGQQDIVVGSPIAGRRNHECEGLVGFFVNSIALRTDLSGELTFGELLTRVKEVTLGAYAHQDLPFEVLVRELRPERSLAQQPILQVMLALQNFPEERLNLRGLAWTSTSLDSAATHFDLALYLSETPAGFSGMFEYATDLFDRGTIERLAEHLGVLMEGVISNPACSIHRLPLLTQRERHQILELFNATQAPYPQEELIHELFEAQVARAPGAIAVICDGRSLTYSDLNSRANRLARYLVHKGVGPDRLVGICIERGIDMIVALLGILKAGGAYVPLDPMHPQARLQEMLNDAAPRLVLTQESLREKLFSFAVDMIAIDSEWNEVARWGAGNLDPRSLQLTSYHLAYVMYTSGSTGRPKGVMVEHAGVVNFLTSMRRDPGICAKDSVLAVTTVSFDIAALEIYLPLVSGAKVVVANREAALDGRCLADLLEAFEITLLQATPATWRLLVGSGWKGRSTLKALCGGEALPTDLSSKLVSRVGVLWNMYGPTETTIWSCGRAIWTGPDERRAFESIGRPIANTRIYILDSHLEPVPIGSPGEIYIGGVGVARGYLNRSQLTAERFVRDSFLTDSQARMYRTGDVGKWRPDGSIDYLGRNDHQVKIRGFRIELGEIEAQLLRHELVNEAVVIAREDIPGDKRLVAYIVPKNPGTPGEPTAQSLRAHLSSTLADYMVPSAFVTLQRLPWTANGKLDRGSLPAPEPTAYVSRQYQPPQGEAEEILARVWQMLLQVERVGRHDNFFELGGHSLHVMKMSAEVMERLSVRLSVPQVFKSPTLQQLADIVDSMRANGAAQIPAETQVEHHAPLSFSQLAHWNRYQLGDRYAVRQIASATRLCGHLNVDVLRRSVSEVVRRHGALRTRISLCDESPAQEIDATGSFELRLHDLTAMDDSLREIELGRCISQLVLEPIDLRTGPLFGILLVKLRDHEQALIVAMEHIISDIFSMNIFLEELFEAYTQFLTSQESPSENRRVQFADYALSQRREHPAWIARHAPYWAERLRGCQRVRFPRVETSAIAVTSGWDSEPIVIGKETKAHLVEWCRTRGTTLVMSVFTAYVGLVLRWCNVADVVVQYVVDGRVDHRMQRTIGYFASTLLLRVQTHQDDSFVDLLTEVTQQYCDAHEHADFSYLEAQIPRPEVMENSAFNWFPRGAKLELSDLHGSVNELTCLAIEFQNPILESFPRDSEPVVMLSETDDEIVGSVLFPRNQFSKRDMERFGLNFLLLVNALINQSDGRVEDVRLV